jgi:hypothetical protein
MYQRIDTGGAVAWPVAAAGAAAMWHCGYQGHLATISDAAENAFVTQALLANAPLYGYWIGAVAQGAGCQPADWSWYTGEPWTYANWAAHEPNCGNPGTPYVHMYGCSPYDAGYCGYWNDTSNQWSEATGYIVEFDGTCPTPALRSTWGKLKAIYR